MKIFSFTHVNFRKQFLTIFLLGGYYALTAQVNSIADQNLHWQIDVNYTYTEWRDNIYGYITRGDTTINHLNYTKVYQRRYFREETDFAPLFPVPLQVTSEYLAGFLRTDSTQQVVYGIRTSPADCSSNTEVLLYNFAVSVGDTLRNYCLLRNEPMIVERIDTLDYYGRLRTTIYFSNNATNDNDKVGGVWIEGVGSLRGLFETSVNEPSDTVSLDPVYDLGGLANFCEGTDEMCGEVTTNVATELIPAKIQIFPNPANQQLNLILSEMSTGTIRLFTTNGKLILQDSFDNEKHKMLNISYLEKGVYWLSVDNQYFGKVVIH